jgi:hypothetical protein
VAALVLAAFVSLLVVRNDGAGGTVTAGTSTSVASTTTSTSTSTTSTTVASTSTTAARATTTTGAPSTTAVLPVVSGQGAVLQGPSSPDTRVVPLGGGCDALADSGWTATCGMAGAKGAVLAWVIETKAVDGGGTAYRALVFRRGAGQQWSLVLRVADDAGTHFSAVRARVEDLSGDGASEIAFGFTRTGVSEVLAVDVVEGPGSVVVHRELPKGAARVSSGQLDTWRRSDSTHAIHEVIQFRDGAWRIVATASVAAADVPSSQL